MNNITGIILAGGQSRRMGREKSTLPWGNETVLQHIVGQIGSRLSPLIVVVSPDSSSMSLPPDVIVIHDPLPHLGPLVGFRNGLLHAPADQPVFLCGCDFPFLECTVIDFLDRHIGKSDAVVAQSQGMVQPLAGLYQRKVTEKVEKLIESGKRSMHALLEVINYHVLTNDEWREIDPTGQMLTNINTPDEYGIALQNYLAGLGR